MAALIQALDSPDEELRWHAERALGSIGPAAGSATAPPIARAGRLQRDWFGAYAAFALGRIRPKISNVLPPLVKAIEDPSPAVQAHGRAVDRGACSPLRPPSCR